MPKQLSDRQKRFCDEYLVDLNASKAAVRAGYSPRSAPQLGERTLKLPQVREYLDKRRQAQARRTEVTQDFVLGELMKIATADCTDFAVVYKGNRVSLVPTAELPPEKRAAVASVKSGKDGVAVKTYDKLRALELIGRHLGMFEKQEDAADDGMLHKIVEAVRGVE